MLFGKAIGIMLVLIAPLSAIANPVSVEVGIEVELFPPTEDPYYADGSSPCCNPSCCGPCDCSCCPSGIRKCLLSFSISDVLTLLLVGSAAHVGNYS